MTSKPRNISATKGKITPLIKYSQLRDIGKLWGENHTLCLIDHMKSPLGLNCPILWMFVSELLEKIGLEEKRPMQIKSI